MSQIRRSKIEVPCKKTRILINPTQHIDSILFKTFKDIVQNIFKSRIQFLNFSCPFSTAKYLLTMVKLASARESRMYGARLSKNRAEYMNAGLYVFATIVLIGGFVAELSKETKPGLVLLLIALLLITVVNLHDLVAHLAGIDYRLRLMGYDTQLALVEFAVPVIQALGALLSFLGILFLFIQVLNIN
jgi:hypothetical protein